jgi:hypothetical protein
MDPIVAQVSNLASLPETNPSEDSGQALESGGLSSEAYRNLGLTTGLANIYDHPSII